MSKWVVNFHLIADTLSVKTAGSIT